MNSSFFLLLCASLLPGHHWPRMFMPSWNLIIKGVDYLQLLLPAIVTLNRFFLPCPQLYYLIKLYAWNWDSKWVCAEVECRMEINMYDLLNQWFSTFLKLSGTWENWLCSVPCWGQLWTHEEPSPCSFVKCLCTCWFYGNYSKSAYNVIGYVIQCCVSFCSQSVRDYMFTRSSWGRICVFLGVVWE